MIIKRISLALTVAALLAGCSSGVKLGEVPVEDKTSSSIPASPGGNTGSTGNTVQGGVAGVDLAQPAGDAASPAGVARIVYFDYDSYVIKPDFQTLLEAHSRFIKTDAKRKLVIEGHTDERGGREYNLALGQKRSEAVRRALVLLGVPDSQIEAISFGKEKLAVPGHNEEAHAKNRRAELSYR